MDTAQPHQQEIGFPPGSFLQGRNPPLPYTLELPTGQQLELLQWLRVLPDQRYVARAKWQNRSVLAKLFVGNKAERNLNRELAGVEALEQQGIPTPARLDAGTGEPLCWVLFEFLEGSISLGERWQQAVRQPLLSVEQEEILLAALACIDDLHRKGLWQSDLHLDNFLEHEGRLHVIDGGGVRWQTAGQPLTSDRVLDNLAVFFAQLPPVLEEHVPGLLQAGDTEAADIGSLQRGIRKVRGWRIRDYLKKSGRDCSLFAFRKTPAGVCAVLRERQAEIAALIEHPDLHIGQGHIYKTGGAATVARVEHLGGKWIIKRYNIKNFMHWLKRCWRPSRAWHSWQAGFLLELNGIPVVQNLAVRETRKLGLRGTAWLISEYQGEEDLIARFAPHVESGAVPEADLQQLQALLQAMIRAKISHGDLKGHNILWHNDRCLLIDLDAVRRHRSRTGFARAFARDRARLLRNWPQDSRLYQLLDEKLPQAD